MRTAAVCRHNGISEKVAGVRVRPGGASGGRDCRGDTRWYMHWMQRHRVFADRNCLCGVQLGYLLFLSFLLFIFLIFTTHDRDRGRFFLGFVDGMHGIML